MYAIMDIGTNSCRLLLAKKLPKGQLEILQRELRITRIGEGMSAIQPFIAREAMVRTLAALEEFAGIISQHPVSEVILVATQAVRMAENQAELGKEIQEAFGWELQIISGEREAWLSYLGATRDLGADNYPLVIDIGGGSTEFIRKIANGRVQARSIPLGALRLQENPLSAGNLDALLAKALEEFTAESDGYKFPLVGVGGTCTTLAAVSLGLHPYDPDKVQGSRILLATVQEVYDRLSKMPVAERLKVPGIYPGREDIIIPGLQLLKAILKYFQAAAFTVSDHDLLYGLIYEQSSKVDL